MKENLIYYYFTNSALVSLEKENFNLVSTQKIDCTDLRAPRYLVDFLETSQDYCVGLVDMVNSTKIGARLNPKKLSKYYEIFLNSMAEIIERYGGFVIKNIGDSLLYYFPEASKLPNNNGFLNCVECGIKMIENHKSINQKVKQENLPPLNYRISVDYGKVTIMKTNYSTNIDVFGTPVNMCTKINHAATKNSLVIGGDMYQLVKNYKNYHYELINSWSIGLKYMYPIYSVEKKW